MLRLIYSCAECHYAECQHDECSLMLSKAILLNVTGTCGRFHLHFTSVTYNHNKISYTGQWMHHAMSSYSAYFATAVGYECKMFMALVQGCCLGQSGKTDFCNRDPEPTWKMRHPCSRRGTGTCELKSFGKRM